ncbi:MAG TPA: response regulator [Cyclobacteriaceae bacterium]|nr:response regulator [Cyclobacteriaceae bacterium]
MKILVVHRQIEVFKQIKSVLRSNNSIIRFSDSGLDGLLAARIESFDLIICGTELPVITGYEVVRSIKTTSVNKHSPVILLTEEITEKAEHLGHALGVIDVIGEKDLVDRLPALVHQNVKPLPDNNWEDLFAINKMN